MIRTALTAAMVLALSLATVPAAVAAAPPTTTAVTSTAALQPKAVKVKSIGFDVRNDSNTPLTLQAGTMEFTLKPGEVQHLRIAAGTPLTSVSAAAHYAAGQTIATVTSALSGTTLALA